MISSDGDLKKLLEEPQPWPCMFLEQLSFPFDIPRHLYDLVTLAVVAYNHYPDCNPINSDDYWE